MEQVIIELRKSIMSLKLVFLIDINTFKNNFKYSTIQDDKVNYYNLLEFFNNSKAKFLS